MQTGCVRGGATLAAATEPKQSSVKSILQRTDITSGSEVGQSCRRLWTGM